jgi:DNA-binding LacI/PurR family transcriptional regulator
MSVNIYDVAKKAGVSVVTVSRVINNYPNVRNSSREKVMAAISELDYKPNAAARSLAIGNTGMIGLVIPTANDSFMSQVLSSIEYELRRKGMFLVVSFAADEIDFNNSNCIRLFREDRVDGILILSPLKNEEYLLELKRKSFPFVLLDQHHSDLQVPSVTVDNFYGGYTATAALIKGGAKRIAHISGPEYYESSVDRLNGYKKALLDFGLEIDEALIAQGDFTVDSGFKITREWIEKENIPDAVFAADDNIAFGVIDAARKYSVSIPEKLCVIGYDDHPFSSSLHPGLSTIKQPTEELARTGIELLLNLINNKIKRTPKLVLKPELILRETTINSTKIKTTQWVVYFFPNICLL